LAGAVVVALVAAFIGSLIYGTPTQLPGVALGWPLLVHVLRAGFAAALVGAVAVIVMNLWRGQLPTKVSTAGLEFSATENLDREIREQLLLVDREAKSAIEGLARTVEDLAARVAPGEPSATPEVAQALAGVDRALALAVEKQVHADAITALPEREKLVFALTEVEGLSYSEVAKALGVSPSRISQLRHRALQRIDAFVAGDKEGAARIR
jgi:RNA polymerase sigma factor (sigma-70 family)